MLLCGQLEYQQSYLLTMSGTSWLARYGHMFLVLHFHYMS
jgi:hypothetical protein